MSLTDKTRMDLLTPTHADFIKVATQFTAQAGIPAANIVQVTMTTKEHMIYLRRDIFIILTTFYSLQSKIIFLMHLMICIEWGTTDIQSCPIKLPPLFRAPAVWVVPV